jgi:hypothetical protein
VAVLESGGRMLAVLASEAAPLDELIKRADQV